MLTGSILSRIIFLSYMVIVGFCLARGIYYKSVMGIILAIVSLGAGIYFLYLLSGIKEKMKHEEMV